MQKKSKKLALRPTLKENRRYFLSPVNNQEIEKAILEYLGILGFAKAGYLQVHEEGISETIGSCVAEELHHVRAALAFKRIPIQKVSGTLRGLLG